MWFEENGQKRIEGNYKNGKKDGSWSMWFVNGQKSYERNYIKGRLLSANAWNINGEKCPLTDVVDGNGTLISYYDEEALYDFNIENNNRLREVFDDYKASMFEEDLFDKVWQLKKKIEPLERELIFVNGKLSINQK